MTLRAGDKPGQRDAIAQPCACSTSATTWTLRAAISACGRHHRCVPAEHSELALRIELFDDEIESLQLFDPLTGRVRQGIPRFTCVPQQPLCHAARPGAAGGRSHQGRTVGAPQAVVAGRQAGRSPTPEQRTRFDLKCSASGPLQRHRKLLRHLAGTAPGDPPSTLTDSPTRDALMFRTRATR